MAHVLAVHPVAGVMAKALGRFGSARQQEGGRRCNNQGLCNHGLFT
jgi:hypothetical protein